jgi:ribosome biogenesis GTPase
MLGSYGGECSVREDRRRDGRATLSTGYPELITRHPRLTAPNTGLIVRSEAGYHRVLVGERLVVCRAPKKLLVGERTATTAVVIGDHVRIREQKQGTGIIEEILPRENELVRGAAGGHRYLDVIAANLDLLVTVHSLREPELNTARLDRFLLIAEAAEIPALVVLNKLDLAGGEETEVAGKYERAGYRVIRTSAATGIGISAFHGALRDLVSALVGPSGAGKSSLLNAVQPGLRLRTGEISEATGKGRHTTTTAELLALEDGGWVADTPGLRELTIREVEAEDLGWLFPEFRPYLVQCRFSDCSHREEPGCAVRKAVTEGVIAAERYRSYLRVYEQLVEQRLF